MSYDFKCPECPTGTMKLSRFRIPELPRKEHTCDKCGHIIRSEDLLAKMFQAAGSIQEKINSAYRDR